MPPAVAALNIGVGPCWGEKFGDMLEAMARITPSQPDDAMARIASRRNRTISLDPNLPGQNSERGCVDVDSKLFSKVQIVLKEDWSGIRGKMRVTAAFIRGKKRGTTGQSVRSHNFTFSLAAVSAGSPMLCGVF
jgi:hypothetical protein